jgi:hypothetical protein
MPYPPLESRTAVSLHVNFLVEGLSPRGVRRRFISSIRLAIARAKIGGDIAPELCEEMWRSLPAELA